MKAFSFTKMIISVVIAELTGALSALLAGGFSEFFEVYTVPPLQPPASVFIIAWIILYALMGVSSYNIYNAYADKNAIKHALTVYIVQLALNFSWSIIFFRFKLLWTGAVIILALIILVAAMIIMFRKIRKSAAYMNIPYLLWLCFALYLNVATAIINSRAI